MRFDASQFRRVSLVQAVLLGAALQILGVSACADEADPTVGQSADTLKGGNGKNKDKTNSGKHMGQAGSTAHGNGHADAGMDQTHGNQGKGAMGSKGGQGQGQGHSAAGAPGTATHGKSDQAHAGSHAQGPKAAGHGADGDDMNDEADETP